MSETSTPKLLPALSEQSALERRMVARILKVNPGVGDRSIAIANSLCDSGLGPSMASAILAAVYSPSDPAGRGQGTRLKWFVEAVQTRYAHKLDKIRTNLTYFRTFVAEMEDINDFRDTLKGEDYPVSFQSAFLFWECGLSAEDCLRILDGLIEVVQHKSIAARVLTRAAMAVKAGQTSSVEGAIRELCYEYRS